MLDISAKRIIPKKKKKKNAFKQTRYENSTRRVFWDILYMSLMSATENFLVA